MPATKQGLSLNRNSPLWNQRWFIANVQHHQYGCKQQLLWLVSAYSLVYRYLLLYPFCSTGNDQPN